MSNDDVLLLIGQAIGILDRTTPEECHTAAATPGLTRTNATLVRVAADFRQQLANIAAGKDLKGGPS